MVSKGRFILISFLVSIFFISCYFLYQLPSVKEFIVQSTTVMPEKFTELYFEKHENLPSKVEKDQIYSFAFTVHNVEYEKVNYSYEIYFLIDDKKVPINTGQFVLNNDEKRTIKSKFTAPQLKNRARVVVELPNKNQEIAFWIYE